MVLATIIAGVVGGMFGRGMIAAYRARVKKEISVGTYDVIEIGESWTSITNVSSERYDSALVGIRDAIRPNVICNIVDDDPPELDPLLAEFEELENQVASEAEFDALHSGDPEKVRRVRERMLWMQLVREQERHKVGFANRGLTGSAVSYFANNYFR